MKKVIASFLFVLSLGLAMWAEGGTDTLGAAPIFTLQNINNPTFRIFKVRLQPSQKTIPITVKSHVIITCHGGLGEVSVTSSTGTVTKVSLLQQNFFAMPVGIYTYTNLSGNLVTFIVVESK